MLLVSNGALSSIGKILSIAFFQYCHCDLWHFRINKSQTNYNIYSVTVSMWALLNPKCGGNKVPKIVTVVSYPQCQLRAISTVSVNTCYLTQIEITALFPKPFSPPLTSIFWIIPSTNDTFSVRNVKPPFEADPTQKVKTSPTGSELQASNPKG